MLAAGKGVGRWKGIAFVCDLCLRGKVGRVWGGTLVVLDMVSPVVVLAQNRLRVAPRLRLIFVFRALTATWRLLGGSRRNRKVVRLGGARGGGKFV
jgi:hypothetical protein